MFEAGNQVLVFVVEVLVVLLVARGLGLGARRLGQPAVVGELAAGLVLGPTLFGRLAPDVHAWLFPRGADGLDPLTALAWLGAVLLLIRAAWDVDLPMMRRRMTATAWVPAGALLVPLLFGAGLGLLLPDVFLQPGAGRTVFALFVAVATAMSALPVISRILLDMDALRRDIGHLTVLSAMGVDVIAWLVLGLATGLAVAGRISPLDVTVALALLAAFVLAAFSVGQVAVDYALRRSLELTGGIAGAFSVTFILALLLAALADWVGLQAIFGAFVAGLLFGRSPYRRGEVRQVIELMSTGVFTPIFFATVGMELDLGLLLDAQVAAWSVVLLVVWVGSKLLGASLGGRVGAVRQDVALAIGVGLNARGAMVVIVASAGLELEIFSDAAFTAVVLGAIVTSAMTPPLLRRALDRLERTESAGNRLAWESLCEDDPIIGARRVLIPTRGGPHSRVAARVVDLVTSSRTQATVLAVRTRDDGAPSPEAAEEVRQLLGHRRVDVRVRAGAEVGDTILRLAAVGHDVLVLGASHEVHHPVHFSEALKHTLSHSPIPVLLVRAGKSLEAPLVFRRILTTAAGSGTSRAAEQVAFALASRAGAEVDVVHVVSRGDKVLAAMWSGHPESHPAARGLLAESLQLAAQFGVPATALTRVGSAPAEEILGAANERGVDTIVVGTRIHALEARPFLGHGTEYLLEHAPQTLIVVAFPPSVTDLTRYTLPK